MLVAGARLAALVLEGRDADRLSCPGAGKLFKRLELLRLLFRLSVDEAAKPNAGD